MTEKNQDCLKLSVNRNMDDYESASEESEGNEDNGREHKLYVSENT